MRQYERIKQMILELEKTHEPMEMTYWGGWEMGYLKGKLSVIEDQLTDEEYAPYAPKTEMLSKL